MSEQFHTSTGYIEVNGGKLYYEIAGAGHPLVLIHGGLVDSRLWDDQLRVFAQHYRVIRYDIRGFGKSTPITKDTPSYSMVEDLHSLLQQLGIEKTALLGLSLGGGIAIDFTLAYPEMVDALIPVAAGLSGFTPPAGANAQWEEIDSYLEKGDFEQAVELENRMWTDGPHRTPDQVDPKVRARVHEMNLHNYEIQSPEGTEPEPPKKRAAAHLDEIHVPTLIIVGDQDVSYILEIADILADTIEGAKKVVIPNTAHHLNMEQPDTFNRAVLDFLN